MRTNVLTIDTTKDDAKVYNISLLLQVVCLINFTKKSATSEGTNMFYFADTSYSTGMKYFKYDSTTHLSNTANITTYSTHLTTKEQYSLEVNFEFQRNRRKVSFPN